MEAVSPEKLAILEAEYKTADDANKLHANELRNASNGKRFLNRPNLYSLLIEPSELAKIKNTPTDAEVTNQMNEVTLAVSLRFFCFCDLFIPRYLFIGSSIWFHG